MRVRGQSIGGVGCGGWFYAGGLGLSDACGRERVCLSCREKLGHGFSVLCAGRSLRSYVDACKRAEHWRRRVWGGWFYAGGLGLSDACGRKRGCLSCREKLGHGSIMCRTPP